MEGNSTSKERRKREMSCISSIIHTESQWSEGEARGQGGGGVMTYKGEDDEEEQNESRNVLGRDKIKKKKCW